MFLTLDRQSAPIIRAADGVREAQRNSRVLSCNRSDRRAQRHRFADVKTLRLLASPDDELPAFSIA
jgi:hypothetical protein